MTAMETPRASSAGRPRIAANEVTVRFGGVVACNKVSVEVAPGSITGLIGPNGAGKTTLFSVLSGLRRPNEGRVFMDGTDITKSSPQARVRRGLSRTFQHPELFTELTVREHFVVADRLRNGTSRVWTDIVTPRGFSPKGSGEDERVDAVVESLGLTPMAHYPVGTLPLGTTRLVELGRALAVEPTTLLLDEPSSGLDSAETDEVAAVLRKVQERGVSMLLVEHDVAFVMSLCDYIFVLDFGVLIAQGTPEEIRADPAVRSAYLGNEFAGLADAVSNPAAQQNGDEG